MSDTTKTNHKHTPVVPDTNEARSILERALGNVTREPGFTSDGDDADELIEYLEDDDPSGYLYW